MARDDDVPVESPVASAPRRIGLVVDHPLRDLDGLCLVAQLLAERGHEAVLMPFYTQHFDLPNLALDAIVLNYARPANLALAHAAAARGVALCVLDTEGGLIPEKGPTSASGIARFLSQSGLDRALSLYLFWGEKLRDHVTANTGLPPERAPVTGCPRFDLAQPPYASPGKAALRGRVLVNTNFPVVNSAHGTGSTIDAAAMRSVGFEERDIADLAENVGGVMQRMIETVHALAKARPARQFIIRPHPFERAEPYKAAFADCGNVRIEREGTAMEALSGAECLLHVNCTTAIEACMVGVPPISLDFINTPRLRDMARLPSEISHPASGLAQALALIDRARDLPCAPASEHIAPFFGPLDGKAAIRVADALATAPLYPPTLGKAEPQSGQRRIAAVLGRFIGSTAIERARSLLQPQRREKAFGPDDVRRRIEQLAQARGTKAAILDQSRVASGFPIMAVNVRPPSGLAGSVLCPDVRNSADSEGGQPLSGLPLARQPKV